MRGNAQPDGARCVGQNSGPIFCSLWTEVQRMKFCLCGSVRSLQRRRFPIDGVLSRSGDIRDHVAKLSEIASKFGVFLRGEGPPKFMTEFYKSGSPSNMWQSLVTIGQATSDIRRQKDLNFIGKTEWPSASISGGRP